MRTRGQPTPGRSLADRYPERASEWHYQLNGNLTPYDVYASDDARVWWVCPGGCGEPVQAAVRARKAGALCKRCAGRRSGSEKRVPKSGTSLADLYPKLAAEWNSTLNSGVLPADVNPGTHDKFWWLCETCGHSWKTAVNLRTKGHGCKICASARTADKLRTAVTDVSLATAYPNLATEWAVEENGDKTPHNTYPGSKFKAIWRCGDCSHKWPAQVKNRTQNNTRCPKCSIKSDSNAQLDLFNIVQKLMPNETVLLGDRKLLSGFEVDIYVPNRKVAIEYNGLYWHSTASGKNKNYHQNKTDSCAEQGVSLIHVWEDEWQDELSREKLIRLIAHKLGVTVNLKTVIPTIDTLATQTIYARKLSVQQITSQEARAFLDKTHLQGWTRSKMHFGLVDSNNTIRAVLSTSPSGRFRYNKTAGRWEIVRFATLGSVPGAFSKLLTNAEKIISQSTDKFIGWETFSDSSHSTGGVYRTAGFKHVKRTKPKYWYYGAITNNVRVPMHRFQRHIFESREDLKYELGWTESQAAAANGLLKIWGLAQDVWVLDVE